MTHRKIRNGSFPRNVPNGRWQAGRSGAPSLQQDAPQDLCKTGEIFFRGRRSECWEAVNGCLPCCTSCAETSASNDCRSHAWPRWPANIVLSYPEVQVVCRSESEEYRSSTLTGMCVWLWVSRPTNWNSAAIVLTQRYIIIYTGCDSQPSCAVHLLQHNPSSRQLCELRWGGL